MSNVTLKVNFGQRESVQVIHVDRIILNDLKRWFEKQMKGKRKKHYRSKSIRVVEKHRQQEKINKENYRIAREQHYDDIKYQENNLRYQEKGLVQGYESAVEMQDFEYDTARRAYEKSREQADRQKDFNNVAAAASREEQDLKLKEDLLSIMFEESETFLNHAAESSGLSQTKQNRLTTSLFDEARSTNTYNARIGEYELDLDTDNDGLKNFIDNDDDGDEILTNDENPDPNQDGDPEDAFDSDFNGIPDFLQFNSYTKNIEDDLEIYNAISPNGDGLNDIMIIRNIEMYPENELYIFNRWSQTIFETKNYGSNGNVFDGRHQKTSRILPVGTYFYLFTYKNKYGLIVKRKGYLYINN